MGTPVKELAVKKKMAVEGGFEVSPPVPNEFFKSYTVVATPTEGVCSVTATGPVKSERYDPSTTRLLVAFMTRQLTAIYGAPTRAEGTDEALAKGYDPVAFWERPRGTISISMMTIDGFSFASLTYTFSNNDSCIETIRKSGDRRARRGL